MAIVFNNPALPIFMKICYKKDWYSEKRHQRIYYRKHFVKKESKWGCISILWVRI